MFVADYMTKPPRTVSPGTMLPVARELMTAGDFRHLPVVDDGDRLVGIVTDRDLRSALPTGLLTEAEKKTFHDRVATMSVRSVMTPTVAWLPVAATLDDALLLFDRTKVGALPVLDQNQRVVGILSIRDLLTAYRQIFGLGVKGATLIAVADDGRPKMLTRLTEALEAGRIPFTRLLRTGDPDDGSGLIYVRIHTYNLNGVHQALAAAGFRPVNPEPGEV